MNKIYYTIIIIFACLCSSSAAQSLSLDEEVDGDIWGYFEPDITATKDKFLMKNNLRLEGAVDLPFDISLVASGDFFADIGDSEWNMLDFVPNKIRDGVPGNVSELYNITFDEDILLHKAYLKAVIGSMDVCLGRQQIPLGTGYVYNPTDVFNEKSVTDPTLELPGHDAVRIDIAMSDRSTLYLFYIPDENVEEFDVFKPEAGSEEQAFVVRYKQGIERFDVSAIVIKRDRVVTDYYTFETDVQEQYIYGCDVVGELCGLGVWAEYAYHSLRNAPDFDDFVIGADHTFINELYVLGEYYRNNEEKRDYELYDLNDWMRFLAGETKTITRDSFYLYMSYPVTDLITAGCGSLMSLNDWSTQIIPSITYSMTENVELKLFVSISIGEKNKSFGESLGNSLTAKIRVYF